MSGRSDFHAILVGDGAVPTRAALDAAWPGWDAGASLVVAADGGATKSLAIGLAPDLMVGDALDDMRMARAAGAHAVGIDSVLGDAAALRAAGATETATSVAAWVDRFLAARV